jgi:hypothetical protein
VNNPNDPQKRTRTIKEVQQKASSARMSSTSNPSPTQRTKRAAQPKSDHRLTVLSIALLISLASFAAYAITSSKQMDDVTGGSSVNENDDAALAVSENTTWPNHLIIDYLSLHKKP